MTLIARASKSVRNKNLIILAMCLGAMGWFGYDGWKAYPMGNDLRVKVLAASAQVDTADQKFVTEWEKKGWVNATPEERQRMDKLIEAAQRNVPGLTGWKTVPDIAIQRWIVLGLGIAGVAAIWWVIHCQRRRVIADETTISPAEGVVVPWEKITLVDNTRWDKVGIVQITFTDAAGKEGKGNLDDYQTDREPLLQILDLLSEKAVNAKFIPDDLPTEAKTDPTPASPGTPSDPAKSG